MRKNDEIKLLHLGFSIAPGSYNCLYSKHKQVVNFVAEGSVVSVCAKPVCPGPHRINLDVESVEFVDFMDVERDFVVLNGVYRLPYAPWQVWTCPSLKPIQANTLALSACHRAFVADAPSNCVDKLLRQAIQNASSFEAALAREFARGMELMKEKSWEKAVKCFKRKGIGLTPAGDDFLVGLLLGLNLCQRSQKKELSKIIDFIYRESLGSDALVNTFLAQARFTQLDEDWCGFVAALACGDTVASQKWQRDILAEGATSGADKLSGFYTALALYGGLEA